MGCFPTKQPEVSTLLRQSKEIDKKHRLKQAQDERIRKLLLLGTGESGKSTFFKQIVRKYGKGFSKEERISMNVSIHLNLLNAIKTIIEFNKLFIEQNIEGIDPIPEDQKVHIDLITKIDKSEHGKLSVDSLSAIQSLWSLEPIRNTFNNRYKRFYVPDGAEHLFNRIEAIKSPDFIPSDQDILRVRSRTSGIEQIFFDLNGRQTLLMDVGGQRNERRKWLHCFDEVTCILFVVGISEYDQNLFEDDNENRLRESLNVFEETMNSDALLDVNCILFLNKTDIFKEKIKIVPLTYALPDYKGENTFEATTEYLKDLFRKRNKNTKREVYVHLTCATDDQNVIKIFQSVSDIIIKNTLEKAGMIA